MEYIVPVPISKFRCKLLKKSNNGNQLFVPENVYGFIYGNKRVISINSQFYIDIFDSPIVLVLNPYSLNDNRVTYIISKHDYRKDHDHLYYTDKLFHKYLNNMHIQCYQEPCVINNKIFYKVVLAGKQVDMNKVKKTCIFQKQNILNYSTMIYKDWLIKNIVLQLDYDCINIIRLHMSYNLHQCKYINKLLKLTGS